MRHALGSRAGWLLGVLVVVLTVVGGMPPGSIATPGARGYEYDPSFATTTLTANTRVAPFRAYHELATVARARSSLIAGFLATKEGVERGGHTRYTSGQRRAFERQLEEHGPASLQRSRTSIGRRLLEHQRKLDEIRQTGGYTSSVEREIQNFESQLEAIDDLLRGSG